MALSGATPGVKVTGEDPLVHHDIHKRQLEAVNAASGLSKCTHIIYCCKPGFKNCIYTTAEEIQCLIFKLCNLAMNLQFVIIRIS